MQENKVVAHTRDGRIIKGMTTDFDSRNEFFHLLPAEGGGIPIRLRIPDLKALFYVRDWLGNRDYSAPAGFGGTASHGRRCIVTCKDGEVIFGFTPDFEGDSPGFTLFPADPDDNNQKIYLVREAVQSVQFP